MGRTLSIRQAAEMAGCSDKTIRNRIKDETLRALKSEGKHGPEYRIPESEVARLMARDHSTAGEGSTTATATVEKPYQAMEGGGGAGLADVVVRLTDELRSQAEELGRMKAITERASTMEATQERLQAERDELISTLATERAEKETLRQQIEERKRLDELAAQEERERLEQARLTADQPRRRWFGISRTQRTKVGG